MASSSITYKDNTIISIKALAADDEWSIKIMIKGHDFTFIHVIDRPYIYKQSRWQDFLDGRDYIGESSEDEFLPFVDCYDVDSLPMRGPDSGKKEVEYLFNIRKDKNKYIFQREGAEFRFDSGPLDICLKEIINKAVIMGYRFDDE